MPLTAKKLMPCALCPDEIPRGAEYGFVQGEPVHTTCLNEQEPTDA